MRVLRGLAGVLVALLVASTLTYGIWLLVTADEGDGGREAIGRVVVGAVAFVVVFGVAPYAVMRLRHRKPHPR